MGALSNIGLFAGNFAQGLNVGQRTANIQRRTDLAFDQFEAEKSALAAQTDATNKMFEILYPDQTLTAQPTEAISPTTTSGLPEGFVPPKNAQEAQVMIQQAKQTQEAAQAELQDRAAGFKTIQSLQNLARLPKSQRKSNVDMWVKQREAQGIQTAPNFVEALKNSTTEELLPMVENWTANYSASGDGQEAINGLIGDPNASFEMLSSTQDDIANPIQAKEKRVSAIDSQIQRLESAIPFAVRSNNSAAMGIINKKIERLQEKRDMLTHPTGSRGAFVMPDALDKPFAGIETGEGHVIDPATEERIPGAIPAPKVEVTGTPGELFGGPEGKSARDKQRIAMASAKEATVNAIDNLEDLRGFVRSPEFVGGLAGDALKAMNNIVQSVSQLTKVAFMSNGQLNDQLLDKKNLSEENRSMLREAAISGSVRDGMVVRIAYILAKQLDPAGRISDRDVAAAQQFIESPDPVAFERKIDSLQSTMKREYNNRVRIQREAFPIFAEDPAFTLLEEGGPGVQPGTDLKNLSNEQLLNAL